MDDGEVDFSDQDVFSGSCDGSGGGSGSGGMESFLDEILKSTHTCTHTHTCNPPGPDRAHTHTCFHTHTQLFATPQEQPMGGGDTPAAGETTAKKKRPLGNREAVRKYREKKKAHAAYLEEQVSQLKLLNQQLVKRLQGQAALEAEVARLRALLADFRGRIDGELGAFPFKKPSVPSSASMDCSQAISGGFYLNAVTVPCDADVPCFHHGETQQNNDSQQNQCDLVADDSCQGLVSSPPLAGR